MGKSNKMVETTRWDDRNHIAESNGFAPGLAAGAGYGLRSVPGSGGHGWAPAPVLEQGASRPSSRVYDLFNSFGPSHGQKKPSILGQGQE